MHGDNGILGHKIPGFISFIIKYQIGYFVIGFVIHVFKVQWAKSDQIRPYQTMQYGAEN